MKLLMILLFTSLSANLSAVVFEVVNICGPTPYITQELYLDAPDYLSNITLDFFSKNQIPFEGNHTGMKSILNTPIGNQAIEIISDTKMRSYGWCYEVDNQIPDVLMNEVFIKPKHTEIIRWFYGYAEYDSGSWTSYCTPVYQNPHPFICDGLYRELDQ